VVTKPHLTGHADGSTLSSASWPTVVDTSGTAASRCWCRRGDLPPTRPPPARPRRSVVRGQIVDPVQGDKSGRGQHAGPAVPHRPASSAAAGCCRELRAAATPTRPAAPSPWTGQPAPSATPTVSAAGSTPSATAAFQIGRRPDARPARSPRRGDELAVLLGDVTAPPGRVVRVLQAQQRGAQP